MELIIYIQMYLQSINKTEFDMYKHIKPSV